MISTMFSRSRRTRTRARAILASFLLVGATGRLAGQSRNDTPTGGEILAKAKGARLSAANVGVHESRGHRVRYTSVDATTLRDIRDLERGAVIGVFDTDVPNAPNGIPPGRYNVFLSRTGGQWLVQVEANGNVVASREVDSKVRDALEAQRAQSGGDANAGTGSPSIFFAAYQQRRWAEARVSQLLMMQTIINHINCWLTCGCIPIYPCPCDQYYPLM